VTVFGEIEKIRASIVGTLTQSEEIKVTEETKHNASVPLQNQFEDDIPQTGRVTVFETEENEELAQGHTESKFKQRIRAGIAAAVAAMTIGSGTGDTVGQQEQEESQIFSKVGQSEQFTPNKEIEAMEEYHERMGTYKQLMTIRKYYYLSDDVEGKPRPTGSEALQAISGLFQAIKQYPPELQEKVVSDIDLDMAVHVLQNVAIDKLPVPNTLGQENQQQIEERKLRYEVKLKSLELSYQVVNKFKTEFANAVVSGYTSEGPTTRESTAKLQQLINFTEIAKEKSNLFEDPQFILSATSTAEEMYKKVSPKFAENKEGTDRMIQYLALSGVNGAQQEVAKRIASGKIDLYDLKGYEYQQLFDHLNEKSYMAGREISYTDGIEGLDRLSNIERVGENITKKTLQEWGLSPEEYTKLWSNIDPGSLIAQYGVDGIKFANEITKARFINNLHVMQQVELRHPEGIKTLGELYGIRYPSRYPVQLLVEQLEAKGSPKTQYGTMISPYVDGNGAFDNAIDVPKVYTQAKSLGVSVRVVEAGDRMSASERLLRVRDLQGEEADFLGVRGHGNIESVELGNPDLSDTKNNHVIDKDFLGVGPNKSSLVLKPDAAIYFDSCLTGARGGIAENFSRHTKGEVVAPNNPTNISDITLEKQADGKLRFDVQYSDEYKAYKVKTMKYKDGMVIN
jgi:hypothetical protein